MIYFSRAWCDVELDIRWGQLAGILACKLTRRHGDPNDFGDCRRCGTDLLLLPPIQRLAIGQRLVNKQLSARLEHLSRSYEP
jgi:hypothetical protein